MRARELVMSGDMIDAKTALELGLVNAVVAPGELMAEARKLAGKLAAKPALALRQAKAALRAAATVEEDAGLRFEQEAFGVAFASAIASRERGRSSKAPRPSGKVSSEDPDHEAQRHVGKTSIFVTSCLCLIRLVLLS